MEQAHRLVGGSTGFVAGLATGFPLTISAAVGATAALSSSLPDHLEGPLRLSHRKITHWPAMQLFVIALITAGIISLSPVPDEYVFVFTGGMAIGCLMHSIADSMTIHPSGIQLLWPISRRGYHLLPRSMRVRVGTKSRSEWAFVVIWCLFVLSYTYARFRHQIFT
jgi:membrane-bound metal-dependent hydrolase YbcI (DUF457 family)